MKVHQHTLWRLCKQRRCKAHQLTWQQPHASPELLANLAALLLHSELNLIQREMMIQVQIHICVLQIDSCHYCAKG